VGRGAASEEPSPPAGTQVARVSEIRPSPENDLLYRPIDPNDPDTLALEASIKEFGVKESLLITLDNFIISGHRRHFVCRRLGIEEVPIRVEPITREDPLFLKLLRECNRQRVKSADEVLREEALAAGAEAAYDELLSQRIARSEVDVEAIALEGHKRRCQISTAKWPMLLAMQKIITMLRDYWPLTDRQIHYNLLNDPPLRHASKPNSRYVNDEKSYNDTTDMLTRGRLEGQIPWNAIGDETRPVCTWDVFASPGPFIREKLSDFMKGYARDLLRSQPNHIEIVGEKNTVESIIRPVAMEFTIPYTIGRGYSSLDPRRKMYLRYIRSGKMKLILLILSDFDAEGEDIPHSFARSMRDDFGIQDIVPVKVGLTHAQTLGAGLHPNRLKATSSRAPKFREKYGEDTYELEAVPPATLQQYLRDVITSILDVDAYNAEVDRERQDAAYLAEVRRTSLGFLSRFSKDAGEEE
jgi:hypothetical protein